MAEPTKADLEAKLAERDREIAEQKTAHEAQIAELQAKLDQQPTPLAPLAAEPAGGAITADLPATRPPAGLAAFNQEQPEVGQYVGHGATSISSEAGTFDVDPTTGLIVGRRKA